MRAPALAPLAMLAIVIALAGCKADAVNTVATPPAVPVVVGQVVRRTVPVTLRAIGNVAAIETVAVRSRVEGQILEVHVKDGTDVTKGQPLFTIDPAPYAIAVERAKAELARDRALLAKAEEDVARYSKLVAKEFVTREQFEAATAQLGSLQATIQADEAELRQAELDRSHCSIVAPISGRTGTVAVDAGNLVKANEDPALVTILSIRPVKVSFAVPEKALDEVRARASKGALPVRALRRGEVSDGHAGTLTFIDNAVDRATGTIRMEATFPNDDRALWPGQFVDVEVRLGEDVDAVLSPTAAIQVGQQGSFVLVVAKDGTAEVHPVVVRRTLGDETIVESGLSGGETVIVDGQLRVVPGAKVTVAAPGTSGS